MVLYDIFFSFPRDSLVLMMEFVAIFLMCRNDLHREALFLHNGVSRSFDDRPAPFFAFHLVRKLCFVFCFQEERRRVRGGTSGHHRNAMWVTPIRIAISSKAM